MSRKMYQRKHDICCLSLENFKPAHHVNELVEIYLFSLSCGGLKEISNFFICQFPFARLDVSHCIKSLLNIEDAVVTLQVMKHGDDAVGAEEWEC